MVVHEQGVHGKLVEYHERLLAEGDIADGATSSVARRNQAVLMADFDLDPPWRKPGRHERRVRGHGLADDLAALAHNMLSDPVMDCFLADGRTRVRVFTVEGTDVIDIGKTDEFALEAFFRRRGGRI